MSWKTAKRQMVTCCLSRTGAESGVIRDWFLVLAVPTLANPTGVEWTVHNYEKSPLANRLPVFTVRVRPDESAEDVVFSKLHDRFPSLHVTDNFPAQVHN